MKPPRLWRFGAFRLGPANFPAASLKISRRAFMTSVGGAAAAIGSRGKAIAAPEATCSAELVVEERTDGVVVRFRNAKHPQCVVFTIPRLYWVADTQAGRDDVRLKVTDRSDPPGPNGEVCRVVKIDVLRARFAGTQQFSATIELRLVGSDCHISLETTGWPARGTSRFKSEDLTEFATDSPLSVPLSKREAESLVGKLFGPRLRVAGKATLSFGHDLSWTLTGVSSRGFSTVVGLTGPARAVATFSVLSFAPAEPSDGPFDADVVTRAFPDVAPPPKGPNDRHLMAMCAVSKGVVEVSAPVELGSLNQYSVEATALRATSVAFQHFGKPRDMLSGLSGDFLVRIKAAGREEGPFLTEGGRIVRFARDGMHGLARLPLATKASLVNTAHGRFIVESANPLSEAPEEIALRPGVVLSTDDGHLKSFSVSALLRQAFLPFPASAAKPERPFFHRLDFAGEACSFVIPGLGSRDIPWSAGSRVSLGEAPEPTAKAAPVQLRLDQAKLRVVRPDDLLSLSFTFSSLALVAGAFGVRITPLSAGDCGAHLVETVNATSRNATLRPEAFQVGASADDRPLMIVEFPPQHVAERAYLRQINDGADPPDVALTQADLDRLEASFGVLEKHRESHLGTDSVDTLISARLAVQLAKITRENELGKAALAATTAPLNPTPFKDYCASFATEFDKAVHADPWPPDQRVYIGSEWLDPDVRRVARRLAAELLTLSAGPHRKPSKDLGRFPAVDPDSPDYRLWEKAYDDWGERLFGGLPRYCGPQTIQNLLDTRQLTDAGLAALLSNLEGIEDFERDKPTPARLSGATRLAFRINCDDDDGGAFPFTLERLTDWSRFDLAVVRRAEKVLDFDSSGRLPPHWRRREVLDAASILRHQNIDPVFGFDAKIGGSIAQRMEEVVATARVKPQPHETAIEIPFRLTLSPAQDARWRTPFLPPHDRLPTPLWQAALNEDAPRSSLRAVWSQDFRPDAFRDASLLPAHGPWAPWDAPLANDDGEPAHAATRFRAVMDAGDRHELVALSSVYGLPVNGRRDPKTSALLADGDQIEPPDGYRLRGLRAGDAIYMPPTLAVSELALSALGGSLTLDTSFEPPVGAYALDNRPIFQAFDVEHWRHAAVLGRDISVQVVTKGFMFPLGHRASFVKTTERRFMAHPSGGPVAYLIQRQFLQIGHPLKPYPGLGQANGGRCFPPKLVNILTRRTPDLLDPNDRAPTNWQNATPIPGTVDTYAFEDAKGAISFSIDRKNSLPGFVFWPRTSATQDGTVRFEIQIDDAGGSVTLPMCFVDNKAAHNFDTLRSLAAYYNGLEASFRAVEHHGLPRRYAIEKKAGEATFETLKWVLGAEGGPAKTADEVKAGNADFAFTPALEGADQPPFYPKLDSCLIRVNQVGKFTGHAPPEAMARYHPDYVTNDFTDKNAAEVFLLVQPNEEQPIPKMAFGASGDRAAGVGRPEQKIIALSRRNGPIGGDKLITDADLEKLRTGVGADTATPPDFSRFDPKAFFGQLGKLLGIIDLGDVIKVAAELAGMPALSETVSYISDQAWDVVRETVLTPLDDALSGLDKSLQKIVSGSAGDAGAQFSTLFTDLDKSKTALRDAVHVALAADQPAVDAQAQLIGDVYEKARALVAALQALESDPIGQIEVGLRRRFDALVDRLIPFKQLQLSELPGQLLAAGTDLVFDPGLKAALFDFETIRQDLSALSDEAGDTARLRSRALAVFANIKLGDLKADLDKTHSVKEVLSNLDTKLASDFSLLIVDAQTDLDKRILQRAKQELLVRTQGPLFAQISATVDPYLKASGDLQSAVRSLSGSTPLKKLPEILESLIEALLDANALVSLFPGLAADQCGAVVDLIVDARQAISAVASDTLAGTEADFERLEKCIANANDCAASASPATVALSLAKGLSTLSLGGNAWAAALRKDLAPALDEIAKTLEALSAQQDALSSAEVLAATEACGRGDLNDLRQLADPLLKMIGWRSALTAAIGDCLSDVAKTLKDRTFDSLDQDQDALSASLSIYQTLVVLLLDPNDPQVAKVIAALNNLAPPSVGPAPALKSPADLARVLDAVLHEVSNAADPGGLKAAITHFDEGVERAAINDVAKFGDALFQKTSLILVSASAQAAKLILYLRDALQTCLTQLSQLLDDLNKGKGDVADVLHELGTTPGLGLLVAPLSAKLAQALQTDFASEATILKKANAALGTLSEDSSAEQVKDATNKLSAAVTGLKAVFAGVADAARAFGGIGDAVAKGDVAKLLDVDAAKRQIEGLIRDLVPHKATMAYKLDTELKPLFDIFIPDPERGACRLTIDTTAVVDLTADKLVPQTTVKGSLDAFNIHLFGSAFDVVLLKFKQANFGSVPGGAFQFHVDLETVVLGEMVQFLEALQSYLSPSDGNGFYLRAASGSPGIEVGYGLNFGTISLGPVSFINVGLDAGCRLPFDDKNAQFIISLSRPDSPFLISVGIYGGGGYLGLIAEGKRIVGFEASFEFGGVAAFSFGPLTGIGRLTTGIFVRKLGDGTTIDGFFFCGGSARIACFGISASLAVTIGMQPGGAMTGQAIFSFSFSIGFAHIDFHVTVFKTQAKLGSAGLPAPEPRTRLAALDSDFFALATHAEAHPKTPRLFATTMSPNRDWQQYQRYFDHDLRPLEAQ